MIRTNTTRKPEKTNGITDEIFPSQNLLVYIDGVYSLSRICNGVVTSDDFTDGMTERFKLR